MFMGKGTQGCGALLSAVSGVRDVLLQLTSTFLTWLRLSLPESSTVNSPFPPL